ncbi:MAG: nicotinate (nicotinamide) nucleotide adenylyltransferase [Oscillospiraceae bacterium]
MRLGIFGGTFNPIHTGHVQLCESCLEALSLDALWLVPTALPPHKDGSAVAQARHRVEMCRLATRHLSRVTVNEMELFRGGRSYTVDTLRQTKMLFPDAELFLLMGSDMFYTLEQWLCVDEVFRLAGIAAVAREEDEEARMDAHCAHLTALGASAQVIAVKPLVTSSTEIRAGNKPDTAPPEVEDYIEQNALYGRSLTLHADLDALTSLLRERLSRPRFTHTLNVASECMRLASSHGADNTMAYLAGLLHDLCKEMPDDALLKIMEGSDILLDKTFLQSRRVWHGYAASIYVRDELNLRNAQILDAIRYHSTGRADMSLLERIVYMADLISAERNYPGVEMLRALAHQSLDDAMLKAMQFIIGDLAKNGRPVLKETFEAYNQLAMAQHG